MSSEMNFQSIADLPVIEGIADGDYIVTVSGGKGKLLPAGNFTGGSKLTVFQLQKEASAAPTSEDGIDAQVAAAAPNYILMDADGNQVTDTAVFREAFNTGIVRLAFDCRASDGPFAFAMLGEVWDFDTYIVVNLVIDGSTCAITIGTTDR